MSRSGTSDEEAGAEVEEQLNQMDMVLSLMRPDETSAFELACRTSPHLMSSRSLRMKFLRAEKSRPAFAAHRLARYFSTLQQYFGSDVVGHEIRWAHLSNDDVSALNSGGIQQLPQMRRGSCPILFICEDGCRYRSPANMLKAAIYIVDVLSGDVRIQKTGIHRIRYDIAPSKSPTGGQQQRQPRIDTRFFLMLEEFLRFAAPIRVNRHHFVQDSIAPDRSMMILYKKVLPKDAHRRLFLHLVDDEGMWPPLEEYGIASYILPIDGDMHLITHDHTRWLSDRKSVDEANFEGSDDSVSLVKTKFQLSDSESTQTSRSKRRRVVPGRSLGREDAGIGHDRKNSASSLSSNMAFLSYQSAYAQVAAAQNQIGKIDHGQLATVGDLSSHRPLPAGVLDPSVSVNVRNKTDIGERDGDCNEVIQFPTILHLESDKATLSQYQCLLRKQIEVFRATAEDIKIGTGKQNRNIELGQIGLRCRHCSSQDSEATGEQNLKSQRISGSVYFPASLGMLYQSAQNLANNHICKGCPSIPQDLQEELRRLRADKRRASSGKQYWKSSAINVLKVYQYGRALWSKSGITANED